MALNKIDLKIRLDAILPELSKYEKMPMVTNVPYAMNTGAINYKSDKINTDNNGFRYTKYKNEYISLNDIEKYDNINILVGNSTVFGVGVTSDDFTISSILSKKSNEPWFNLSIRGAVCITEYIHIIRFLYKAKNIKNIVILSGIVDIYINLLVDKPSTFEKRLETEKWLYSCKKRIISRFFAQRYKLRQLDIIDKNFFELLLYPFKKDKFKINYKKLTYTEQMEDIINNIKKIFFLYSGLSKQLDMKVIFMLQPYYYWCNKKKSKKELETLSIVEELEKGTFWEKMRNALTLDVYNEIINKLKKESDNYDIEFKDMNTLYDTEKTIFADYLHFTDDGSAYTADLILKNIN